MSRKLQETQTTVQCPKCQQAFRLSADDSIRFLREMKIEVECPICFQQVNFSVIPKASGTHPKAQASTRGFGKSGSSGSARVSSGNTKIGLPPFKALGKETVQVPKVETLGSVPFAPIQNSSGKAEKARNTSMDLSEPKNDLGNKNQTNKMLMGLVAVMGVSLIVVVVLLVRKPNSVGNAEQTIETSTRSLSQPIPGAKDTPVQIPSEDFFHQQQGRKVKN